MGVGRAASPTRLAGLEPNTSGGSRAQHVWRVSSPTRLAGLEPNTSGGSRAQHVWRVSSPTRLAGLEPNTSGGSRAQHVWRVSSPTRLAGLVCYTHQWCHLSATRQPTAANDLAAAVKWQRRLRLSDSVLSLSVDVVSGDLATLSQRYRY